MADIAEIGFVAKTDQLDKAKTSLNALRPAAEAAEKASERLNKTLEGTGTAFGKAVGQINNGNVAFRAFGTVIGGVGKILGDIVRQFGTFAVAMAGAFAVGSAIEGARKLSHDIANLATVLPDGTKGIEQFTSAAAKMADTFGTNSATQVDALYEAVSAGATSLASSTALVDSANKLAIGGSASLAEGIDVLTTATNAYAKSGLTAAQASDAIFVGVAAGKARVGEFASQLGDVIPAAASLNVSFDQLIATIATLTLTGIKVPQAVTSINQALSNILKPQAEATKLAKQLGIEFNSTALQAKGLAGFLQDVIAKTKGNQTSLAALFGSIEAVKGVFALTGAGADNLNLILDQMKNKAGATDQAFQIMAANLDFRMQKITSSLSNAAAVAGTAFLKIFVPFAEGILKILNGTSSLLPTIKEVGTLFLIAFSPIILAGILAIAGALASLAAFMFGTLIGAIQAVGVALIALAVSNPFTAILFGITTAAAAIWGFRDTIQSALGVDVVQIAINTGNSFISAFANAYNAIVAIWAQLPSVIGAIAIGAANAVISAVEQMINAVIAHLNGLMGAISKVKGFLSGTIGGEAIGINKKPFDNIGNVTLGKIDNPGFNAAPRDRQDPAGPAMQAYINARNAVNEADRQYIGIANQATAATNRTGAAASQTAPKIDALSGALAGGGAGGKGKGGKGKGGAAGAADDTKTALQLLNEEFTKLNEPFSQAQTAFNSLHDLLTNGIITNEKYASSLDRIKTAFMTTGGTATQWGKITQKSTSDVGKSMEDLAKKGLTDLGDEFINLAMGGQANFKQLTQSLIKDMLKIMWQALVVKPLLSGIFGGGASFGGGGGSPKMGTANLYANGGTFDSIKQFAGGGQFTNNVFDTPTLFKFANGSKLGEMGEAGPEAVMPLSRGPDGKLGVQANGGGSAKSTTVQVNVGGNTYYIEGAISQDQISSQIKQTAEHTLEITKKSVTGWLQLIQRDGAIA